MRGPRKLALYGDEQEQHSDQRMTERLLRLIGKARPRIGYIPEAAHPDREQFSIKREYYAAIGAYLAAYFDEDSAPQDVAGLLACDAIHLSGGNTFSFLYWLKQRDMLQCLRQYVGAGGVLIGVSAGSILMTPRVATAALCGDAYDPRLNDDSALALVGFHFWPHFDPHRSLDPYSTALVASLGEVYACQGGAGLIVDGDEVEHFGAINLFRL